MIHQRYQNRAGYSLIEAVVLVAVFSTMMTAALSWIHLSMKFSRSIKDRTEVHQQLGRLSSELRQRIGDCESFKVEGDTLILESNTPVKTTTRYKINDLVIEREAMLASDPDTPKRETFRIGRDVDARWGTEELPDWVSLTVRQKPVTRSSGDSASSIASLETPKLEFYLRAARREVGQ